MKDNIDIDEKLNELIIRYKIDRFHPRFAKNIKAKQIMQELFEEYKDKDLFFVAACQTDIDYLWEDCAFRNKGEGIVYYSELDDYHWNVGENTVAVITSFYGRREVMSSLHNAGIQAISIYDYLAVRGLIPEGNYYDIFGEEYHMQKTGKASFDYINLDMNAIFFYDRRNYEISEAQAYKELYLAKMIFDCVYIKDWILVKKYIEEYVTYQFSHWLEYQHFYQEIEKLLNDIKNALMERQEDDIVVFWLDALEFGEDKDMPFLCSLADKSIDFVNAYTVTPFTHSTAKTLFAHKCVADDRAYKLDLNPEDSLIKMLEEHGYQFRFYTKLEQVQDSLKGRLYQNEYTPFAEICWNMIHDILKSEEKIFAVCHEVLQTHAPFISYGLSGKEYVYVQEASVILSGHEKQVREGQILESRKYTDDVLCMYTAFLPDNVYKIYMSDHGHTELDKYHTIFRIVQKDIVPEKIEGIFSYIHFDKLVYKMIQNDHDYSDMIEEFAQIQDVDYYNQSYLKLHLGRLLQNPSLSLEWCFGYTGIITRQYTYIRYNNGRERYYNNMFCTKPLKEKTINYLRTLCTEYPQDIINDGKFRASRNIYATVRNYWKRNGGWEQEKVQKIRTLFDALPAVAHVAIRGGGRHTWELWFALKQEQQEKIAYIIDADKRCMAARLGLKVINMNDIKQEEVDMILVSSFKHEAEWIAELKNRISDIPVIGLYDYLKENGIECKVEFYKKEYAKEDIVWEE